jgi:hypothetical protein
MTTGRVAYVTTDGGLTQRSILQSLLFLLLSRGTQIPEYALKVSLGAFKSRNITRVAVPKHVREKQGPPTTSPPVR